MTTAGDARTTAPAEGREPASRWWRFELRPPHAIALLVLTSLLFVAPAFVRGATTGAVDIVVQFAPYQQNFAEPRVSGNGLQGDQAIQIALPAEFYDSLRDGDLQLWEPDIAGGTPLFTAVYNRILSPVNWPFLVVPAPYATTVGVFLGMLLAQLGVYGLGRRLGLGVAGAAFAAVAYAFSGPMTAFVLRFHETLLLPAWLFAIHGTVTDPRRRWRFAALTGVVTAALWFGGFPATAVMSTYVAAFWTLYLLGSSTRDLLHRNDRWRHLLTAGGAVGVAVVAGLAIASVQLLPTVEFLDVTLSRTRVYGHHHIPSAALAGALSGRFFGAFQDGDWWWPDLVNVIESSSTVGVLVLAALVTLILGLRSRSTRGPERVLAAFAMPTAILVLQSAYFGRPFLSALQLLPTLDETSFPRARFIAVLMIALTAGYGVDRALARERDGGRPGALLRAEALYVPVVVGIGLWHAVPEAFRRSAVREVAWDLVVPTLALAAAVLAVVAFRRHAGLVAIALVLLVGGELQWGSLGLTPFSEAGEFYPDDPAIDAIRDEVGVGGQFRYFDRHNLVLYGHTGAYLDLNDALAHWPAYGPYQQLVELSDPNVAATSAGKAVFEPTFSEALDLGSPALDAVSAGWFLAALSEPPVGVAGSIPVATGIDATTPTTLEAEGAGAVRALTVGPVRVADPACSRGWVELTVAGATYRRLLREVVGVGAITFPTPDIDLADGAGLTVSSTDCEVALESATVDALLADPSAPVELASTERWQAYRRPSALPRLSLAAAVVSEPDPERRLARIAHRPEGGPVVITQDVASRDLGGGTARFLEDGPDEVVAAVESDGPGVLVLRDVNAPGWHATVDGEPVPVLDADHAFRAVEVPDGSSRVVFRYAPASYRLGVLLAVGGLLTLVLLVGLPAWRRRRGARGGSDR